MNFPSSVFIALAMALAVSVASAADAVWPKNSANDISIFVTILRFRIYADHCSAEIPQLEPKFKSLMENLSSRIQGISIGLLAFDEFKVMKDKPVPVEIIDALKHSFHDVQHNVERLDAASICSKTLQSFIDLDDEALKSGLTANLRAVQNMTQKLEKANAR